MGRRGKPGPPVSKIQMVQYMLIIFRVRKDALDQQVLMGLLVPEGFLEKWYNHKLFIVMTD